MLEAIINVAAWFGVAMCLGTGVGIGLVWWDSRKK